MSLCKFPFRTTPTNFLILLILMVMTSSAQEEQEESSTTTSQKRGESPKSRNSELLSYKMYSMDDNLTPVFKRAPNSDYLILSRMQRHANRKRKRNHNDDNVYDDPMFNNHQRRSFTEESSGNMDNNNDEIREKRKRRRHKTIPKNVSRQALDSLRSSVVIPSLGQAIPLMMAKRKQGFCKTIPFQQKIGRLGCNSKFIKNNYCFGSCNSFYIPPQSNNTIPFTSCSYCTPKRYRWIVVRLECPYYYQPRPTISPSGLRSSDDADDDESNDNEEDNKIQLLLSDLESSRELSSSPQTPPILFHTYQYQRVQIVSKCRCQT